MATYYVSTTGVGSGPGTIGAPWSLTYAAAGAGGAIHSGDTVYLRGGTYSWPITGPLWNAPASTVKGYPGETAIIDGAIVAFNSVGNSAWELVDAPTSLYRSTTTYPAGTYFGFITLGGTKYSLCPYKDRGGPVLGYEYISSTQYNYQFNTAYYCGPGVTYRASDQRLYCRLFMPDQSLYGDVAVPRGYSLDPRNHALEIFSFNGISQNGIGFSIGGGNCTYDDLKVKNYFTGCAIGVSGVTLGPGFDIDGYGEGGIVCNDLADNLTINHSPIRGHMPSASYWVTWEDVKGGITAMDSLRKYAIGLDLNYPVDIIPNIQECFDGILTAGNSHDITVHGTNGVFNNVWDDAWQMYSGIYNIEIKEVRCYGAGFSHDSSGSNNVPVAPGTVYRHHYVIDNSVNKILWARGDAARKPSIASSTHGVITSDRYAAPHKEYYCTYYCPDADGQILNWSLFGQDGIDVGVTHDEFNNVAVWGGYYAAYNIYSNSGRERIDGNVYHFSLYPGLLTRWRFVHTSTGTLDGEVPNNNTNPLWTLAGLKTTQAFADSQVYYSPGWENSGLEVNPQLDAYYRPTTTSVKTGAVNITGTGWPGTSTYQAWRGAIDPVAATVTGVSSPVANGAYTTGNTIPVTVTFNRAVTVSGTPQLTLSTGSPATTAVNYVSGSGSTVLTFNYTVATGNTSVDLDYASTAALALNGGSIRDPSGNPAVLTLASPGAAGSLGANKALVINVAAPTVTGVSSTATNGTYTTGAVIPVQVTFSQAVTVTGTPRLTLATGSPASTAINYTSGSGTTVLTFTYTVASGNISADLDYTSTGALALNGGTIRNGAALDATLTLAAPGAAGSLGANKAIVINTAPPSGHAESPPLKSTEQVIIQYTDVPGG